MSLPQEELYERQIQDAEDAKIETLLRTDWDYAIDKMGLSKDMTVAEFSKALHKLQEYGWDVSAQELLEYI